MSGKKLDLRISDFSKNVTCLTYTKNAQNSCSEPKTCTLERYTITLSDRNYIIMCRLIEMTFANQSHEIGNW